MFYIDQPGDPLVLADLQLVRKLDIAQSVIGSALSDISAHEASTHLHFSYDLKNQREEPHLIILSCFARGTTREQMLDIVRQALEGTRSVLLSEPHIQVICLGVGDYMFCGFGGAGQQDIFVLEGDHEIVNMDLVVNTTGFLHASTFQLNEYEDDEEYCQLLNLTNGFMPIQAGSTGRVAVLFDYRHEEDRELYINPIKECWDYEGSWSRYQDGWVDWLSTLTQKGVTVQEFSVSLQPWPPRSIVGGDTQDS